MNDAIEENLYKYQHMLRGMPSCRLLIENFFGPFNVLALDKLHYSCVGWYELGNIWQYLR